MCASGLLVVLLGFVAPTFDVLGHLSPASNCSVEYAVRCGLLSVVVGFEKSKLD